MKEDCLVLCESLLPINWREELTEMHERSLQEDRSEESRTKDRWLSKEASKTLNEVFSPAKDKQELAFDRRSALRHGSLECRHTRSASYLRRATCPN